MPGTKLDPEVREQEDQPLCDEAMVPLQAPSRKDRRANRPPGYTERCRVRESLGGGSHPCLGSITPPPRMCCLI